MPEIKTDEQYRSEYLQGISQFTTKQLSKITQEKEFEISELNERKQKIEADYQLELTKISKLEEMNTIIPNWKEEFKKASIEEQQSLLSTIVDVIYLFRDKIEIHFKYNLYNL